MNIWILYQRLLSKIFAIWNLIFFIQKLQYGRLIVTCEIWSREPLHILSILVMDNKPDFLLTMILYVVHANYFAQEVQTRFSSNNPMNKQQGLLPWTQKNLHSQDNEGQQNIPNA